MFFSNNGRYRKEEMLKIYLDNCCYNRPYDDLTIGDNDSEATAKLYIQSLVKYGRLVLVYSYMSVTEVADSIFEENKRQIMTYVENYATLFVSNNRRNDIEPLAKNIMQTGIKNKDAIHLACAMFADCDYFITTDKRILKHETDKLKIVNPIEFVNIWRKTI
jgi:predicted nucleic acid-binding protein